MVFGRTWRCRFSEYRGLKGATLTFYTGLASVAPLALPLGGLLGSVSGGGTAVCSRWQVRSYSDTATGRYRSKRHRWRPHHLDCQRHRQYFRVWRSSLANGFFGGSQHAASATRCAAGRELAFDLTRRAFPQPGS